ncbi:hypothetical protein Mapa_013292 [Marchantia paleacea]|nr:hypothetical protein Mapa_013292 [Marchantia paleacea]
MKCAQCEKAEATVRCLEEKLDYCEPCSQALHGKKARKHHQLKIRAATSVCDECEAAPAKLECLICGGGQVPLVFCFECCSSLHSRSARANHSVRKYGYSTLTSTQIFIDLTDDRDEQSEATVKSEPQELKRVKSEDQGLVRNSPQTREEIPVPARRASTRSLSIPKGSSSNSSLLQCKRENIEPPLQERKGCKESLCFSEQVKREVSEEAPSRPRRVRSARNYAGMAGLDSSEECSSDDSTSDSEEEFRGTHKIKRGSITVEAFVVDATDQDDTGPGHTGERCQEAVNGIRFKIKKMLELGLHPDTPDIEAQQALKNAQRLLTKHNLEQAEVLQGNLTDTSTLTGGMRVVELRAKGRSKLGRMESWVLELGWVISDNFDTQFFFKSGSASKPFRVVFYGISQNADCAGYAFAATFNRITIMSAEYIVKYANQYDDAEKENQEVKFGKTNQGINTRVARANYRRGIVAGLKEAVENAKRTRSVKSQPFHEGGTKSEGEDCDAGADFPSYEKDDFAYPEDDLHADTPTKFSLRCMTITALVQHSKKVGEDFLQSKGIKVRKRTKPNRSQVFNEDAYVRGKKDAESIDINQKALENVKAKRPRKTRG